MSAPRVSVIVPAYRSEERIGACVEGLTDQGFTAFEVVVVNSSEEEPTRARVAHGCPQARFVQLPTRLLPHDARNVGARVSRARLLVFTDPDCIPAEDWLERLVARADPGAAAVAGSVAPQPAAGRTEVGAFACKFRGVLGGGSHVRRFGPTANFLVERRAFDLVGGFRPGLFAADVGLCVDLARRGIRVAFEPTAVVRHGYDATLSAFLRERLARGADFGRVRPELEGWSSRRSVAQVVATPLAGIRVTAPTLRAAQAAGLELGLAGVATVLAGQLAWVAGEAAGYAGSIRSSISTV
jgi:GT2 family glycosyltransferase